MGGLLADPVLTLPGIFGEGAIWGFDWIFRYPYALPSLINAITLTITGLVVFLDSKRCVQQCSISNQLLNED